MVYLEHHLERLAWAQFEEKVMSPWSHTLFGLYNAIAGETQSSGQILVTGIFVEQILLRAVSKIQ